MDREEHYNDDIFQRVQIFEEKLASGEHFFYDTDDLEEIIEYYFETEELNKAWKAINFGQTLFPYENFYQIKKAEILLNRKEIKAAIKILEDARNMEPNNTEIAKLLGDCYCHTMQYKRAVDFYNQALRDDFAADEIYLQLIKLHFILNKPEKAIGYLNHLGGGTFIGDTVLPEIVKLLTDFKQTDQAITFLRDIIHHDPYSYSAWYFLGYCFQKKDEYKRAIDAFEYCIAIDDQNSMGYLGKGNSLVEIEKYEEAIEFYKQALENDITDAEVYCNIAECYEKLDNLNSAKYHYLKAIKIDKHLPDAYYGLGIIYKNQGRYGESEKNFMKAIDLDPFECLFHIELGELYLLMDEKDKCFQHYGKAMELDPSTPEIVLDFAQAMLHFEETEHSITLLKDHLGKIDNDHRFYYRIASYLFHLGTYEAAYNFLHMALEMKPQEYTLLFEYAPFTQNNINVLNIIDLYVQRT